MEQRKHSRTLFVRQVRVEHLTDVGQFVSRNISAGGIFLTGCTAAVGDRIELQFDVDELPGLRIRATAVVAHLMSEGAGCRFESFHDGGTAISRLVKYLFEPEPG